MERGFLSQKGSAGEREVKEKNKVVAIKDVVSPSVIVEPVGSTPTGNTPGMSSYANVTGKPSRKKVNVCTLFTPEGNGIDVVVPLDSIRAISERFANTAYDVFLGEKDAMLENGPWFIQNNPLILKKWHPDENLLKEDVSTIPVWVKLHGVPVTAFSEDGLSAIATKLGTLLMLDSYTSDVCMQSWGRSSYARVIIELKADVELKDNIVVAMSKITSGIKKKGVEPTIEVSNSNLFDVLNSVDNDGEFGTNRGANNLINNEATSSGSSFMNIDNDGECASNTPIGAKIDKIERQIGEVKLRLLDNDGNPLVPTGIVKSDSEVELVFDETANLRILTSGKDVSDKEYPKWEASNAVDLTKVFGDDARPRPPANLVPQKNPIGYDVEHRGNRKAEDFIGKFAFRIQAQMGSRPIVVRDEEAKKLGNNGV
nr:hypothetical protein [Tanacetum cinerariifolium]